MESENKILSVLWNVNTAADERNTEGLIHTWRKKDDDNEEDDEEQEDDYQRNFKIPTDILVKWKQEI